MYQNLFDKLDKIPKLEIHIIESIVVISEKYTTSIVYKFIYIYFSDWVGGSQVALFLLILVIV